MYAQVFQVQSALLKAMSHPKRLEIIHLLRDQQLSVTEIQEMLDLPQANLSQHLQVLRLAQIVTANREGKQIFYRLSHPNVGKANDLLREILIERYQDNPLSDELTKRMKDLVPLVHDPVCRMRLSPKTASTALQYRGSTYYFCASGCLQKFKNHPGQFMT